MKDRPAATRLVEFEHRGEAVAHRAAAVTTSSKCPTAGRAMDGTTRHAHWNTWL
jgi:hypothetical protein